jgi:hypothetical protein
VIKLDYTFMTEGAVEGAIADSALASASDAFAAARLRSATMEER